MGLQATSPGTAMVPAGQSVGVGGSSGAPTVPDPSGAPTAPEPSGGSQMLNWVMPSGTSSLPLPSVKPGTGRQPAGQSQSGIDGTQGPVPGAKSALSKTRPLGQSAGRFPRGCTGHFSTGTPSSQQVAASAIPLPEPEPSTGAPVVESAGSPQAESASMVTSTKRRASCNRGMVQTEVRKGEDCADKTTGQR